MANWTPEQWGSAAFQVGLGLGLAIILTLLVLHIIGLRDND